MQGKDPGLPPSSSQHRKETGKRQVQVISPKVSQPSKLATAPITEGAAVSRSRPAGTSFCAAPPPIGGDNGKPAAGHPKQPAGRPAKRQRTEKEGMPAAELKSEQIVSLEDRLAAAQAGARPKSKASSYVRPKQKDRPPDWQPWVPPVHGGSPEREANKDLPSGLPVSFPSAVQYITSYEALIFEEAREYVLHCRTDSYTHESQATIIELENLQNGWSKVRLSLERSGNNVKEGALVIISSVRLPDTCNVEWFADACKDPKLFRRKQSKAEACSSKLESSAKEEPEDTSLAVVAGIIRSAPSSKKGGEAVIGIHPACPGHSSTPDAPCQQILGMLRPRRKMWVLVLGPMVTQLREFAALHKVPNMSVGEYMLHPERLAELGAAVEAQHKGQPHLPRDVYGEGVLKQMQQQFDSTQFGAIAAATRHLDVGCQDKTMPFVLICGPPGTGKTHTVTGVLNVWHLAHYTQHQNSIMETLQAEFAQGDFLGAAANVEHSLPGLAAKPRLLVCAPSNAAADELLQRVMSAGFVGNDGRVYFPNVVRVGAPGANIGERAKAVLVDGLVQGLLGMDPQLWHHQMQHTAALINQLTQNIVVLQMQLAALEVPDEHGPARDHAIKVEIDSIRQLVERHDARSKHLLHRERLMLVGDHVNGRLGQSISEVRECLELSLVGEAEMVFTTLSSTGRRVFRRLASGHFETVLIDEAAQASEVTTLQALTFGCRRVVLVGDPQQLPATVLSQRGKDLLLERSLFERLQQAGCPVHMLQVQYRMHPFIRQFPSRHFYENRLQDGPSVLRRPPEVFYRNKLLQPYTFFDVSGGRDVRALEGGNAGSRRNQAEAELAVALFQALRDELLAAVERKELKKPVVVGVVTPYKEQVQCIKDTLEYVLGAQLASEVTVSTIDSYQGRQLDVIILSCVRANPVATGVGFVADMRRMNVSITRAKRALWILGSASTLQQSPVWASLLDDARQRGLLKKGVSARLLFPHLPQFQSDFCSPAGPAALQPGNWRPTSLPEKKDRAEPNQLDQQLQDSAQALSSAQLLEELELGSDGIPGLDLDEPELPGRPQSMQPERIGASQPSSRDISPSPDDDRLYSDEPSQPSSRTVLWRSTLARSSPGVLGLQQPSPGRQASPGLKEAKPGIACFSKSQEAHQSKVQQGQSQYYQPPPTDAGQTGPPQDASGSARLAGGDGQSAACKSLKPPPKIGAGQEIQHSQNGSKNPKKAEMPPLLDRGRGRGRGKSWSGSKGQGRGRDRQGLVLPLNSAVPDLTEPTAGNSKFTKR